MDNGKVTIKTAEYERLKRDSKRLKQLLTEQPVKQHVEKRVVKSDEQAVKQVKKKEATSNE